MRAAHRFSRVPCLAVAALLMVSTCPAVRGSVEVPRRAVAAPPSKPADRHAAAARKGPGGDHGSDGVGGDADCARPGVDSSQAERLQARNARPGVTGSSATESGAGGGGEGGGVGVERGSSAQQVRLGASRGGWIDIGDQGCLAYVVVVVVVPPHRTRLKVCFLDHFI